MVLTRSATLHVLARVVALLTGVAALSSGACFKRTDAPRLVSAVPATVAWVVDRDGDVPPGGAPPLLVQAGDALLGARNVTPTEVAAASFGPAFDGRRATAQRMAWLREQGPDDGLLVLVELAPRYDNLLQGRFRWLVSARITIAPSRAPERALDVSFEVPVFLQLRIEGPEEAMEAARGELLRRLGTLLDGVVQDPDAPWAAPAAPGEGGSARHPTLQGPIYLVMADRFSNGDTSNDGPIDLADPQAFHGGDLRGLTARLDTLASLGVKTVWLTPLTETRRAPFDGYGAFHGYWMFDPARLDPHFGSEQELTALREALRARGMGLLLDVVTNHVGYDAPVARAHPDWFHDRGSIQDWSDPVQVVEGQVHGLPDLNQDLPAVRAWLRDAAFAWIDRADPVGMRLDAVRHVPVSFWAWYNGQLAARGGDDFAILGELFDGNPVVVAQTWRDGGFRQMLDFPLHYAVVDAACRSGEPAAIAAILDLDRLYPDPTGLVPFVDNHDLPRVRTVCQGDDGHVLDALTLIYAVRGAPMITWGTEAGLSGGHEADARADMVFGTSTSTATRLTSLASLRVAHPALSATGARTLALAPGGVAWAQGAGDEVVIVAMNRGTRSLRVPLPDGLRRVRQVTDLIGGEPVAVHDGVLEIAPGPVRLLGVAASRQVVAALQSRGTTPVRFEVRGLQGGNAWVVGSAPELGGWSAGKGLGPLRKEGDVWVADVDLPGDGVVAWKVVTADSSGVLTWEPGPNRYTLVSDDAVVSADLAGTP